MTNKETVKNDQETIDWDALDDSWEERYVEDYGHLFGGANKIKRIRTKIGNEF